MRERFMKSYRPFNLPGDDTGESLREIFLTFDLKDFQDEITFWLDLALSNNQSVYQDGNDREDVIDFCRELIKLVGAFNYLSLTNNRTGTKTVVRSKVKKKCRTSSPAVSGVDEQKTASATILNFRDSFSPSYVELEICDLLDAVITYEGVKTVNRENLILFYQCVKHLLARAYTFQK